MHNRYNTEWWHHVGNLRTKAGRKFGFQLTFFRKKIAGRNVFMAHAAVTDIFGNRYLQAERKTRHPTEFECRGDFDLWIKGWQTAIGQKEHRCMMQSDLFSFDLRMQPGKPVLNGKNGKSRKGNSLDRFSYYYSVPDMATKGTLTIGGESFEVEGSSWLDHEFFSACLEPGIVGWDWFGLNLSDGSNLMVYKLRLENGGYHRASSGTITTNAGVKYLRNSEIRLEPVNGNGKYPALWILEVPGEKIAVTVSANVKNQEFVSEVADLEYWEGSVKVKGSSSGMGYAELTGYGKPFCALSEKQGMKQIFALFKHKFFSLLGR